ncbi:hypothetical protein CERZMDRAFT_95847 [Cercospora zeae-maydis SCOH1-5]|uniref:Major facilitator superfamily (MFS) profile domain-containing protein n=1 Tax=Cercospora zeae-maydis SCOH1-5 TaxID=717836 RepID=A0A6A6FKK3_9PEZI|nr:hypothetical protein CERZMDRAFT_95847 [Cercospora zeae-maydis SCOH1-5]
MANGKTMWQDIVQYRRTYLLTAVASFGGMLFGWDTGLIGAVLTMKSFQNSFGLDEDSPEFANLSGNIVSVLQAGCFFGALASFFVSDKFGRKTALIFADVIFIIGSIIQTCSGLSSTSLAELYVGRVVGGFGVGLISAVVPTYIGENANKEIRGRCIGCMQLFNVTGIMLSYFVNYGCNQNISSTNPAQWRVPFALQILPGVLLLFIVFLNESPRWLVEKQKIHEARKALATVRALSIESEAVERELEEIIEDFNGHEKLRLFEQIKMTCREPKAMYTFSMAVTLMFWQQWTGTNSINYYSPQIFKSAGLVGQSAGLFATGIYGVVKVVFTSLALMLAVESLGRKWCLIMGALGQAFAMFYIGINQAVNPPSGQGLDGHSIFAIICVYLFVVFYSFGWGAVPFVLSAECAPNQTRSLVMSAALMTQWLFNFVIAKLTPIMLDKITYGTFLLFGGCCILMAIYTVFCIPETKGVPLESIHLLFEGGIFRGALKDTIPGKSRAKALREQQGMGRGDVVGKDYEDEEAHHVEQVERDDIVRKTARAQNITSSRA